MNDDKETIDILDKLIVQFRTVGLKEIPPDLSSFGSPTLNFIYTEVYQTCINGQPTLSLSGSGIFLEEFVNELWISSELRRAQLQVKFDTWDEVMSFLGEQRLQIESQEVEYVKDIRPVVNKIFSVDDLRSMELLRKFIRNTFVHSKRTRLISTLQKHKVLPDTMPVGRMNLNSPKPTIDEINVQLTHPMISQIGFHAIAKQLAPAMLIYSFTMFERYNSHLGPIRDDKIKFPGK